MHSCNDPGHRGSVIFMCCVCALLVLGLGNE